jgi:hypothetical protein
VTRISWQRVAAVAGLAFVVLYVAAFALGIEVGDSDREILAYFANGSHRAKEIVAFFLVARAALALLVFTSALRSLIARAEQEQSVLAALAGAGGIACAVLVLAGNAVLRRRHPRLRQLARREQPQHGSQSARSVFARRLRPRLAAVSAGAARWRRDAPPARPPRRAPRRHLRTAPTTPAPIPGSPERSTLATPHRFERRRSRM